LLLAIFVALLAILCSQRWLLEALIEAVNSFRGGQPKGRARSVPSGLSSAGLCAGFAKDPFATQIGPTNDEFEKPKLGARRGR
jgi:hypothetical protein